MKKRAKINEKDKWNVKTLYSSQDKWEKAFTKASKASKKYSWPNLNQFQDKLAKNISNIKKAIEASLLIEEELETLYTYAHLRHDEDIANDKNKKALNQISSLYHMFAEKSSWLEPEILSLPEKYIEKCLKSPILKKYKFYLEKVLHVKKHTLSPDKEELIAKAGQALGTAGKTFSALNDADLKFNSAKDKSGKEIKITHSKYGLIIRGKDRTLRKNAFKKYHNSFFEYENSICELLNGQMQSNLFYARSHNYKSCLEAALHPKNISPQIYYSLIKTVNKHLGAHHKYIKLRKKKLKLKQLHLYDMYVPLTSTPDIKFSYQDAESLVIESVEPLGDDYQQILQKGLQKERWVDRYENENKRSGAYSSGCYNSSPYILMNFNSTLNSVFTLAHENGHSMHSYLSNKNQPYLYSNYPIFVAEVASTFNEELLLQLMLKRASTKSEKALLINQKLENIRTTLFRQTMFAEFELFIHECAEQHIPITPTLLKEKYLSLNNKYFGKEVIVDKEIEIEWARIPHFYYNFYVYQYATGISAAMTLANNVTNGTEQDRKKYLTFLKSGCSKYPIDLLKTAGADLSTSKPVEVTIKIFEQYIKKLEEL